MVFFSLFFKCNFFSYSALNVLHAGQWTSLCINFSIKECWSDNVGHHVTWMAINGDIVTSWEFICGCLFNSQVGLLDLCQCVSRVMTQSAYKVSSVIVIIRVTPERRRVAQILAIFTAVNGLIDRIHRLENFTFHTIINAKSTRFTHDAIALHIICARSRLESSRTSYHVSIHIQEAAILCFRFPNSRPEIISSFMTNFFPWKF